MSGTASADRSSFRDPAGHVFEADGRIFRSIGAAGLVAYRQAVASGALRSLIDRGLVVGTTEVGPGSVPRGIGEAGIVVEHPKVPFVSYPFEWSFPALKAAALHHLLVQLEALRFGMHLSDASAYNIQFVGPNPVLIDILSLVPYEEGSYWNGYLQFCEQFLNPLLLRSTLGILHNHWYRGSLRGLDTADLDALLPWYRKLSPNMLMHVVLPARARRFAVEQRERATRALENARRKPFPRAALVSLLRGFERWIERLEPRGHTVTAWGDYTQDHAYLPQEEDDKQRFIRKFVAATRPAMLWDLGCNVGVYASLALECGADYVVGFDFDPAAIERAYRRALADRLRFLPLQLDAMNPSPDQGWDEHERRGLRSRGPAAALLALAIVHHLAIAHNVPLNRVVAWLVSLAPAGVVEFVPKSDPAVRLMLAARRDIFDDYLPESFEYALRQRTEIIDRAVITASGRTLYRYAAHP